jgi:hypothetical protein
MINRYLTGSLLTLSLLAAPAAAQQLITRSSTQSDGVGPIASETTTPTPPSAASASAAPLRLRGRTVATGLHGFYDYQSNGGSPEYIAIRPGAWTNIYTTFMNSLDGSNLTTLGSTRRAGYAVSTDGGATWSASRSIADLRLGYPAIEVTAEPVPYIAAHGDAGAGNQVIVYANPVATQAEGFIPLAAMPVATASGRGDRGVIWNSFELNADGTRGYLAATYFSELPDFPPSPIQFGSVDLASGTAPDTWTALPDSIHSTTSGGRYVLARSASGKLGLAWFRSSLVTGDTEWGVYYSESTDDGVSWTAPQGILVNQIMFNDLNISGDEDTLSAGANIDGAYIGEELHLTLTGNMNGLLRYGNVLHWSPSLGLQMIALSHQVEGMGAYGLDTTLRQSNMGVVSYPTMAVSEDGQKIVVAFSAVDQHVDPVTSEVVSTANEAGFLYYRLWAVGSPDGGATWGTPFLVQDFAGEGTDSASIEYPAAAPIARMVEDNFELNLVFQGRRQPGQFAFLATGQFSGEIEDVHQYFQRFMVTPEMFESTPNGVAADAARSAGLAVTGAAPNPATDRATITYTLGRRGAVTVRVIDGLGRVVATALDGAMREPGLHSHTLYTHDLDAGMYRVVLEQDGAIASLPIVVR